MPVWCETDIEDDDEEDAEARNAEARAEEVGCDADWAADAAAEAADAVIRWVASARTAEDLAAARKKVARARRAAAEALTSLERAEAALGWCRADK